MVKAETHQSELVELLNMICMQEGRAGVYLKAWANKTQHPDLKKCLSLVANREANNSLMFRRRIEELGFEVQEEVPAHLGDRMVVATSDTTDAEKIVALQEIQKREASAAPAERYEAAIADETVDPLTRAMLRYWREVEADSGRHRKAAYAKVQETA